LSQKKNTLEFKLTIGIVGDIEGKLGISGVDIEPYYH